MSGLTLSTFLETNNYKASGFQSELVIQNQSNASLLWSILAVLLGIGIVPSMTVGGYKLVLLVILLIVFSLYKTRKARKFPKRIKFDTESSQLYLHPYFNIEEQVPFSEIEGFELFEKNEYYHASPFNDETSGVILNIYLVLKSGTSMPLLSVKENKEDKTNVEELISAFNEFIK